MQYEEFRDFCTGMADVGQDSLKNRLELAKAVLELTAELKEYKEAELENKADEAGDVLFWVSVIEYHLDLEPTYIRSLDPISVGNFETLPDSMGKYLRNPRLRSEDKKARDLEDIQYCLSAIRTYISQEVPINVSLLRKQTFDKLNYRHSS